MRSKDKVRRQQTVDAIGSDGSYLNAVNMGPSAMVTQRGEYRLVRALVEDAIDLVDKFLDNRRSWASLPPSTRKMYLRNLWWVLDDLDGSPLELPQYTFGQCCEVLDIDAEAVQKAIFARTGLTYDSLFELTRAEGDDLLWLTEPELPAAPPTKGATSSASSPSSSADGGGVSLTCLSVPGPALEASPPSEESRTDPSSSEESLSKSTTSPILFLTGPS
jgi:hypothetical protein